MKKLLLILSLMMSFWFCNKKTSDKTGQTKQPPVTEMPVPKVVETPAVPVDTSKSDNKLSIPKGISPDLIARLQRTACYGHCPTFTVEVFKDGRVRYNGVAYAKRKGDFEAIADAKFITAIQQKAAEIKYLSFKDKYPTGNMEIADLPSTISYVRIGDAGKLITNNHDAPKELIAFERWLETAIESLTWKEVKN